MRRFSASVRLDLPSPLGDLQLRPRRNFSWIHANKSAAANARDLTCTVRLAVVASLRPRREPEMAGDAA
jgi:hypothetical protein